MEQVDVVYSLALFLGAPAAGGVMGARTTVATVSFKACFELF